VNLYHFVCMDNDGNFYQYRILSKSEPTVDSVCCDKFNRTQEVLENQGWIMGDMLLDEDYKTTML
jgi:hypothetical protein